MLTRSVWGVVAVCRTGEDKVRVSRDGTTAMLFFGEVDTAVLAKFDMQASSAPLTLLPSS